MLSHCKISQHKIKKILKCFADDYTSSEAAKLTKLNRKTTDRYYKFFGQIVLLLVVEMLESESRCAGNIGQVKGEYLGCIQGAYGPKARLKIYKMNKTMFLFKKVSIDSDISPTVIDDEDWHRALNFTYKRLSKRQGFTEQSYYYQLYESSVKYNYTKEELFCKIWDKMIKMPKKI